MNDHTARLERKKTDNKGLAKVAEIQNLFFYF